VKILGRVPKDGVAAVAQACAEAWRLESAMATSP